MSVAEQGDVSRRGTNLGDNAIGARADLFRRLAARTAVAKNRPTRPSRANLFRRESFVLAIVPLDQVGLDIGKLAKPSEFAGFAGALERTREDQCKGDLGQNRFENPRGCSSVFGQWNIGDARMSAIETPLGFAVAQ